MGRLPSCFHFGDEPSRRSEGLKNHWLARDQEDQNAGTLWDSESDMRSFWDSPQRKREVSTSLSRIMVELPRQAGDTETGVPQIEVTPEMIERAFRVLDGLIEDSDYQVRFTAEEVLEAALNGRMPDLQKSRKGVVK